MSKRTWVILGIVFGSLVLLIVAVVGAGFWAWGKFKDTIKAEVNQIAVVQEHIGEIQEFDIDFQASAELNQENTFVMVVKGTKASGSITARVDGSDPEGDIIKSGTLKLDSGETHDLVQQPSP